MGGLTGFDPSTRRAELYAFVSPVHHGQGYGTQLVSRLCNLGFSAARLNRVFLWTYAMNAPAIALYSKVGFITEGCLRQHSVTRGTLLDRQVMGLLRAEWQALPWADPGVQYSWFRDKFGIGN